MKPDNKNKKYKDVNDFDTTSCMYDLLFEESGTHMIQVDLTPKSISDNIDKK